MSFAPYILLPCSFFLRRVGIDLYATTRDGQEDIVEGRRSQGYLADFDAAPIEGQSYVSDEGGTVFDRYDELLAVVFYLADARYVFESGYGG